MNAATLKITRPAVRYHTEISGSLSISAVPEDTEETILPDNAEAAFLPSHAEKSLASPRADKAASTLEARESAERFSPFFIPMITPNTAIAIKINVINILYMFMEIIIRLKKAIRKENLPSIIALLHKKLLTFKECVLYYK